MSNLYRYRFIFSFINLCSKGYRIYLTLLEFFSYKQNCTRKFPLEILLIYSKSHFDPESSASNLMINTGTGYWAKWFYESLLKFGNVDYLDLNSPDLIYKTKKYDLIIGLNSKSFRKASEVNANAYKLLVGVNSHPLFRNSVLLEEAKRYKVNLTSEIVNPFDHLYNIVLSDNIFVTGDYEIAATYYKFGVKRKKITLLQGMPNLSKFPNLNIRYKEPTVNILYPAGQIGLRKGALRFLESWPMIEDRVQNVNLTIIGKIEDEILDIFNKKISRHRNISIIGWSTHEDYVSLLNKHHLVVLLSLEEGQVFSVMEAISCGCIPLISKFCGFTLPSKYVVNNSLNNSEVTEKVCRLIESQRDNEPEIFDLSKYIMIEHNFEKLKKIIQDIY